MLGTLWKSSRLAESQCSWLLFPDGECRVENDFTFLAPSFSQDGRLYSPTVSPNKPFLRVFFKKQKTKSKKQKRIFFVTITEKPMQSFFLQMSYLLIGYIVSVCEADGVIWFISPRNKSE